MKSKFPIIGFFAALSFALSVSACSSSSSGTDAQDSTDECLENPSSPNCLAEEDLG